MNYSAFRRSNALIINLSAVSNERCYHALWRLRECTCSGCKSPATDARGRVSYVCKNQDSLPVAEYNANEQFSAQPGDAVLRRGDKYVVLRWGKELAVTDQPVVFRTEGKLVRATSPY